MEIAKALGPEFSFSPDELATHYLNHSGLDQRERKEIFKDVGGVYDADLIKEAILKYYDRAQELDEGRVLKGKYNRHNQGRHRVNSVAHEPHNKMIGSDLIQDIVDFLEEIDNIKLSQPTFDPNNPVYLVEPSSLL